MLEASFFKEGISKLGQLLKRELPQAGDRFERGLSADVVKPTYFKDVVKLANGRPPIKMSEYANLEFRPVKSPLPLTGGHNPIQAMKDQHDRFWIFKAIEQKNAHYRAVGDKVGSDLANAVGLPSPVVHYASEKIDGVVQFGTVQPLIKHSGKPLPLSPQHWTEKQRDQLTASHVFRWLIGDHDGKAANFLVMKDGNLVPIDFGNMFRNVGHDVLDRKYQPNPIKPLYNRMWDSYVKGAVDINFHAGLFQVSKIEAMSDQEFLKLLEPYADARYARVGFVPKGVETKEKFMQMALERKQNIRRDISTFYDSLAKERGLSGLREALGTGNPWASRKLVG
ncbi:MAG: phage head morphosis protein family [Cyanobacteria bacterium RYN_339]|nr:phage head morphosis protein family [Cyanobacteria bacterium RYN_339]